MFLFCAKLFLMIVFYCLFLPINILACAVCRFLWYPGFTHKTTYPMEITKKGIASIKEKEAWAWEHVDRAAMSTYGDGPKMLGLLSTVDPTMKSFWLVWDMIKDGTFYRSPNNIAPNLPCFSGDQLSGVLTCLWAHHQYLKDNPPMLATLKKNFDKVIFFNKVPFTFCDAAGKLTIGRGWVWTPWEPTHAPFNQVIALLSFMNFMWPEDVRYHLLRKLFKCLGFPVRWCHDFNFWAGPVYMQTWYAAHSNTLFLNLIYYMDTSGSKYALRQMSTRYPWNADIQLLAGNKLLAVAFYFLKNYNVHMRDTIEAPVVKWAPTMKKYISVRSFFKVKEMSDRVLDSANLMGAGYIHEENPLEEKIPAKAGFLVDYLFTSGTFLYIMNGGD